MFGMTNLFIHFYKLFMKPFRYSVFPKNNIYKRKRIPQRPTRNHESDDVFYYTPAAYVNSSIPEYITNPSKYNTKRLKAPFNSRGRKVAN